MKLIELPQLDGSPAASTARLEAFGAYWRQDAMEDALEELEGAFEELAELARGDKHPGSEGHLVMELDAECDRASKALGVISEAVA